MSRLALFFNVRFLQYAVLALAAVAAMFLYLWVRASDENRRLRAPTGTRP